MTLFSARLARLAALLALGAASLAQPSGAAAPPTSDALKATLRNGLRVVIVRNTIAPVISTDLTYLVGSRDDPANFPGIAHAQEHMMFRGTKNLSTSQLGTIATALGGDFNASTTDTLTQYQFTVPAADLDNVLRIESDRMRDVLDAQEQWQNERGAIEQEVLADESRPGADFFGDARSAALAGTPYAHDGVGTREAFDRLTGPQIKAFYDRWYAPNNAVLVIAGDLDPARTLAQIRERFESIPARPVAAHAAARFAPLRRTLMRRKTTLVYPLAVVAFRLPGIESPDFLPSFVLQAIMGSQRAALRGLVDSGEALDGQWISFPYVPEVQLGMASAALPPGADPLAATKRLEGIVKTYADRGVPSELFESTKRRLIADQELSRNSIAALASDWATTTALDQQPSIAHEQTLIANVTLAEVDRVAKRYLDLNHAVIGALTPSASASQNAAPAGPRQGPEKPLDVQAAATTLPEWANRLLRDTAVPPARAAATQSKTANGMTLIVRPETISDSVFMFGSVRSNANLQEPPGKEGVASVLDAMFGLGTETQDRATFVRAQDDIDAEVSAGSAFGVQSTGRSFERAVALLARNELAPRFDEATFVIARRNAIDQLATALNSTATAAARRAAQKLLPPGDPELREPTLATLQALTLDDVKSYYAKTIRPDATTIVVIGNVSVDAARGAVERAFANWHASGDLPALDLPPVPVNGAADVKVTLPPGGQASVSLEQVLPLARSSPQLYPLQLGNAILGGGSGGPEQSRLFRDLRQNAGLVYGIGSHISAQRTRAKFSVEFASSPENAPRIATLIDSEIEKMRTQPVGDFELALAKAAIVRRTVIADSSLTSIGGSMLENSTSGLPLDEGRAAARQFIGTDARAIQQAFADYIHPQNFVRVVVSP